MVQVDVQSTTIIISVETHPMSRKRVSPEFGMKLDQRRKERCGNLSLKLLECLPIHESGMRWTLSIPSKS